MTDPLIDPEDWEPQLPPPDFAERVMGRVREERAPIVVEAPRGRRSRLARLAVGAGVVLAVAAALALRITTMAEPHGEAIAVDRTEVSLGGRARAVLEPGAQVKWDGDDVVQAHGDVFYRVEPGARFRVHTPAGDVEVKGTCFAVKVRGEAHEVEGGTMNKRDVKSGAIGAVLTGLAFVAVYEGKVAVSHASERVDLAAGESAQVGPDGVQRTGKPGEGEKAFDSKAASAEPLAQANDNLVAQVSEYRARLEAIAAQKLTLEQTLKNTEQKLAAMSPDGAAARTRDEFDVGPDEWKELAKDGTVKYQVPCVRKKSWTPQPELLQKLALAPDDGPALKSAFLRSNDRVWSVIKPICAQSVGSEAVAEKLGQDTCTHLVLDLAAEQEGDKTDTKDAMRQVGEIRAGLRQAPAPGDATHPVLKMFLALTGAMKDFETDLAQTLGPEEAHRVAFADGMCAGRSTFRR